MSSEPAPRADQSVRSVFVVEDETIVAVGLKKMLARLGIPDVHLFTDAEAALEQLEELRPDLVLMDIKLGDGMDGLAAAREVMERRPCPVVISTAYTESKYIEEAMQSHVFGYLVKPVTVQQLAGTMSLAAARFREFQALQEENVDLRDALETRKLVERAKGILMHRKNLSEGEAYDMMRTQSQQKSLPMREVARSIISAADFL